MKRARGVLVVLLGLLTSSAFAQKPAVVASKEPGWHKIGEITASFKMQNDAIAVWGADKFSAIKLKVTDAPINIERLQVFYENGEVQEVNVKNELQAGAETRTIDLTARDNEIEKVSFTYQTMANYNGDKAHVELYGYKNGSDSESNSYRNDADSAKHELREDRDEAREEMRDEKREAREDARETKEEVKKDADKTGNEISEAAGNVGAEIKDKPYVDKVGPHGERIFMDRHSKYYYINESGKKVSITKIEMKDNPKKD
jgi:hypothetical protein